MDFNGKFIGSTIYIHGIITDGTSSNMLLTRIEMKKQKIYFIVSVFLSKYYAYVTIEKISSLRILLIIYS